MDLQIPGKFLRAREENGKLIVSYRRRDGKVKSLYIRSERDEWAATADRYGRWAFHFRIELNKIPPGSSKHRRELTREFEKNKEFEKLAAQRFQLFDQMEECYRAGLTLRQFFTEHKAKWPGTLSEAGTQVREIYEHDKNSANPKYRSLHQASDDFHSNHSFDARPRLTKTQFWENVKKAPAGK
jgi:hypothetical protein